MLDGNLISAIIFYAIIILIVYFNRKKFDIYAKVIALHRMKFGIRTIDRIAKSAPRFFRGIGYAGIVFGFVGMIFIVYTLIVNLVKLIIIPETPSAIALVVPGVRIPGSPLFVPFWYGIISIFIVVLVHEASHGILARAHGLKVRNTGIGMFAIFPIAFVEPDETALKRKKRGAQLSIFAAGPFSNIILGFIVILIISFAVAPWAMSLVDFDGVEVKSLKQGFPADTAGLEQGDLIVAVNGILTPYVTNFTDVLDGVGIGEEVVISTAERDYTVTTVTSPENASKAHIGIFVSQHNVLKQEVASRWGDRLPWGAFYLLQFLQWLFILNFGIGLANLLPLGPVDGGRMLLAGLGRFFKKETAMFLWKYASLLVLLLLILNFVYPYLRNLI
jgi:membrane-associated protease RseP (regulator of RpoE activity)